MENVNITKENYQDLTWNETIPMEAYHDFYGSLELDERVEFLKFLLVNYPNYDEEWIEYYFDTDDYWSNHALHEKKADFVDFLRLNAPTVYQKEFDYLAIDPILYALFQNDLAQVKARFAAAVENPVKAVDNSLRTVFDILTLYREYKDYAATVAETVRIPLQQADQLIGDASFDYATFLYTAHLETLFTKIQDNESIDWDHFTREVEKIEFKFSSELKELPNLTIAIDEEQFHKASTDRDDVLDQIAIDFFYYAFAVQELPIYWAFRAWFNLRRYLLEHEDSPKRKNWFAFTPKMLDQMRNRLYGFLGENRAEMIITTHMLPHIYDFFLTRGYIDESTFNRLATYFDFNRRTLIKDIGSDLWKYRALYTWKKPDFLSAERYQRETELAEQAIELTREENSSAIKDFVDSLSTLPKEAEPPIEPSPFEKIMRSSANLTSPRTTAPKRKKKKRKKKHKDNRKRGKKRK